MKHKIYELCLFLNIFYFESKESLNIPEYRCLLIGRVQYLDTIEPAVKIIAYHRVQLISVTLLSLDYICIQLVLVLYTVIYNRKHANLIV